MFRVTLAFAGRAGAIASAIVSAIAFAAFTAYPSVADPIEITDDTGRRLRFDAPLERAIIFNRYNAELIRAIAGTGVIVGVDSFVTRDPSYWPSLRPGMLAGQGQSEPNYEAIVALEPDVVIFPRNGVYNEAIRTLAPFNIPVVVLTGWDVLKHVENVEKYGRMFGAADKARKLNEFYLRYMNLLARRLEGVQPKKVYLEEVTPFRSVLPGSGWHDMIEAAGGVNVFADLDIATQPRERGSVHNFEVDPEAVLMYDPMLVAKLQPGSYPLHPPGFAEAFFREFVARPGMDEVTALKEGQVFHMNYYLAGGCSKMTGALSLAKWLHPERFADIDPDEVMRVWIEEFQGVPYPGRYWTSINEVPID
ncbi:MAG: ABC transporter substrate-binding protein [Pseudomonadota bacterium]